MNNKLLYGIISVALLLTVGVSMYLILDRIDSNQDKDSTNSARTDTNTDSTPGQKEEETKQPIVDPALHTSDKGVKITVNSPMRADQISSPVSIKGTIPGNWSNEGQFTVRLLNNDGIIIAEGPATLDGDWMTEDLVPFTASLEFEAPEADTLGLVVLEKANPSDKPENSDSMSFPVRF